MSSSQLAIVFLVCASALAPFRAPAATVTGELRDGDGTLSGGEYRDLHDFEGRAGDSIVLDLTSSAFDPYLMVLTPDGETFRNDDYDGSSTRSRLELTLTESGRYRVTVTSFAAGETGNYRLELPGATAEAAVVPVGTVSGRLEAGDDRLADGAFFDTHTFEGRSGQRVVVDLRSEDFDTVLQVVPPTRDVERNDDVSESSQNSRLELTLHESGTYRVRVTSFDSGMTGDYTLELPVEGGGAMAATPSTSGPRSERGRLQSGDDRVDGKYRDIHTFEGQPGEQMIVDLRSSAFDPYLVVRAPSGATQTNDDFAGSTSRSQLELAIQERGTYRVEVTSYAADGTGAYELALFPGRVGALADARVIRQQGRLESGDETLGSGEFKDNFFFEAVAGERVVIDLRSEEFDPYLILRPPVGDQQDNDDHEGSASWSQIATTLTQTGTYTVTATTYKPGSTGGYEYVFTRRSGESAGPRRFSEVGRLEQGDAKLSDGEYNDSFPLELTPGNRVVTDLRSSDFDTYVVLRSPSGEVVGNDDYEGSEEHSRIEHTAAEAGEYRVFVTSYEAGESGAYRLDIQVDEQDTTAGPASDLIAIGVGQTRRGRLESTDPEHPDRGYSDLYAFEGVVGQSVAVDLRASDLDSYLVVTTPGGREIENDDFGDSLNHSRIEIPIEEAGRYRVRVTSYASGETGDYELAVQGIQGGSRSPGGPGGPAGRGEIYGIFVGVSDYGGRANDLSYTDRDAVRVHGAMLNAAGMSPQNGYLLQNAGATRAAFETALRRIASTATERDTVVIFFSGHGDRVPRPTGFDRADPDGMDETLEFYDRPLLDDELSAMLDTVRAGRQLLVFDSCFSGGFAKDVISVPGRMGLFSSEEDVTSAVAAKFRAGGYLSVFFGDSIIEAYADEDGDGGVSAIELSHYIAECYRAQVKGPGDDYVSTSLNLGYQKLVVDRGSIAPYDIVFRRR